jgi:hypothetical protein
MLMTELQVDQNTASRNYRWPQRHFHFFRNPAAHCRVALGMIIAQPLVGCVRRADDRVFLSNISHLRHENEMDACSVLGVHDGGIGIDVHE